MPSSDRMGRFAGQRPAFRWAGLPLTVRQGRVRLDRFLRTLSGVARLAWAARMPMGRAFAWDAGPV